MKLTKSLIVLFFISMLCLNGLNYADEVDEAAFEEPDDLDLDDIPVEADDDNTDSQGFTKD